MLSAKHDSDYDNVVLGRLGLWINLFICPLHSHYITVVFVLSEIDRDIVINVS